MAQKIFNIDAFPQGYYMSWFVTTQAAYKIQATLQDDRKTYFSGSKTSTKIEPPLAQGAGFLEGSQLRLTVDIPQSRRIDSSINTYVITSDTGNIVGFGYNISIEDQDDRDYNDVCISLVAWKNKG